MSNQKNWTKEEHILAFNLYCKIPFTKINSSYSPVMDLARIMGRSSGSVAMKLANFARLDPVLKARNISGLTQGAKGEEEVWNEFINNWEELSYESEIILARYKNSTLEKSADILMTDLPPEGKSREAIVKLRVNQLFFRNSVLASYDYRCCITGISVPELLVAGHIIPWAVNQKLRTNPANGLCLNALHDKAFDRGLMTITPDYEIRFSERLLEKIKNRDSDTLFIPYNGEKINLPQKFYPLKEFLDYHNQEIFQK